MRAKELLTEAIKQRLDAKCWKGKHKEGTKIKGGVRVNNCVPNESLKEFAPDDGAGEEDTLHKYARMWYNGDDDTQQKVEQVLDRMGWEIGEVESEEGGAFVVRSGDEHGKSYIGFAPQDLSEGLSEDWQKVNKHDKTDGMSHKAVKAYRRENPGSKLKTAVTTKPSKLKKGSKSAKRRKSFCARMSGMKKAHASAKTKRDPDSPINKALRRWNCESIEQSIEQLEKQLMEAKAQKQEAPKPRNFVAKNAVQSGAGAHKDKKKAAKQGDIKHKSKAFDMAEETVTEKASRALCTSATPDKDLGASNLASCKSQGLRARDGEKSHLITAGARKVRIKVGGKKIKGKKYGGPLPDYGTRK